MLYRIILCLIFAGFSNLAISEEFSENTQLPLLKIVLSPSEFSGKIISFSGFVDLEYSDSALIYPTLEYLEYHMDEYAIKADKEYFVKYKFLNKARVNIKGLFEFEYCEGYRDERVLSLEVLSSRTEKLGKLIKNLKE